MEKSPIQKKLSWALGCALLGAALALAFPVEVTVEGLAAPVTAVGQALRGLSLSGGAGNAAAWGIVLLVSALPLVPWFLLRRRGRAVEDWLLVLLIPQVFALLYYAVNPTLIGSMAADFLPLAQMLAIVSTALTWLVLRFLRGMAEAEGTRLVSAVSVLLTGCALVLSLGAGGRPGRGLAGRGGGGPGRERRKRRLHRGRPGRPGPAASGPLPAGGGGPAVGRAAGGPGGPGALRPGDGRALRPGRLRLPDGGPGVRPAVSDGEPDPAGPL